MLRHNLNRTKKRLCHNKDQVELKQEKKIVVTSYERDLLINVVRKDLYVATLLEKFMKKNVVTFLTLSQH